MAQLSNGISKAISRGAFSAIALSLTFGAVAFGHDLSQQGPAQLVSAEASSTSINRSAKADRAMRSSLRVMTRTVSVRLNDLSNTSVLIRVPLLRETPGGMPTSLLTNSGTGKATVACEPVVSVLTEVAKQLQPGRCVT